VTYLSDLKSPRPRFTRSINVERDTRAQFIDSYLPVSRAVEMITRLAKALDQEKPEAIFSVTGPYGSGKSSFVVVLDALLGAVDDPARLSAEKLFTHAAPTALVTLDSARKRFDAHDRGFIRAVATARREPVALTIVRALLHGLERYSPSSEHEALFGQARDRLSLMSKAAAEGETFFSAREIQFIVATLGKIAPIFLLIDEFGKNLEALSDSPSAADLYLLQELAEQAHGNDGVPLALVTLQHMAFDEYAGNVTAVQRREWAKIQGRFEDIPFVDSPAQTRELIAAAFEDPSPALIPTLLTWAKKETKELSRIGLIDLSADPDLLSRCWPLHPLALAVLPELCERYGQNERTLFSFLTSSEPLSVASFLTETAWEENTGLPLVRLDRVYDYFIESAATMRSVSSTASRWVEIDTRIRDVHGLGDAARRLLKTIGLLNLVSTGGALRASKEIVLSACCDEQQGTSSPAEIEQELASLEQNGLVTFRDFADEYRVWQGSDYDLKTALDVARQSLRGISPRLVLEQVLPLDPIVAGRHSHLTGALRAFARHWADVGIDRVESLGNKDNEDGVVFYVLGGMGSAVEVNWERGVKPVGFVTTTDTAALLDAAHEMAAVNEVLASMEGEQKDRVVHRELLERRVIAHIRLDQEFETCYGATSNIRGSWTYILPERTSSFAVELPVSRSARAVSASRAVSEIADIWYEQATSIHNDLVNRHRLSSQAVKARRVVIEAMLATPDQEALGIQGHGPDNTIYRSVLRDLGLHVQTENGWEITAPPPGSRLWAVWEYLNEILSETTVCRTRVDDIYERLAAPPYGLRAGIAPIILVASLIVNVEEVALYEHGTFRPVLTADLVERLLRNPGNFELKHFSSRAGIRAEFLARIADRLGVIASAKPGTERGGSVLSVVSHLLRGIRSMPKHIQKTGHLTDDARVVRRAFLTETEPDELIFSVIPKALGKEPIPAVSTYDSSDIDEISDRLSAIIDEFNTAYSRLLKQVQSVLREELRGSFKDFREDLRIRAQQIKEQITDQNVATFAVALSADIPGDDEWIEYVAMSVSGLPPGQWTDANRKQFFVTLHEVSGTFRRVEALNADLLEHAGACDPIRVTLTRLDGTEDAKLVWVDEVRRKALENILREALSKARAQVDSDTEASDAFLALLADRDLDGAPRGR